MELYIANVSQQDNIVQVRLPEVNKVLSQTIPAGRQIRLGSDLSTPQVDAVVYQLGKTAGMIKSDEIARQKRFVPLIFSVGKPVDIGSIRNAISFNRGVLKHRGEDLMEKAAVVIDARMGQLAQDDPTAGTVQFTETSVQEEKPGTLQTEDKPINGGVRVEHRGDQAPPTPKRRRRAAA